MKWLPVAVHLTLTMFLLLGGIYKLCGVETRGEGFGLLMFGVLSVAFLGVTVSRVMKGY